MIDVDDMWDDEEDNEMVGEMFGRRKAKDDYEHVNKPSKWIADKDAEITRLRADLAAVTAERDRLREVVKRADSYIHNGIELGFIRHCDTPEDPAYHTPRIVREAARAAIEGVKEP